MRTFRLKRRDNLQVLAANAGGIKRWQVGFENEFGLLSAFTLSNEQYFILSLLAPDRTLAEVASQFQREFPKSCRRWNIRSDEAAFEFVLHVVAELKARELAVAAELSAAAVLFLPKQASRLLRPEGRQIFFIRLPLFRPDSILTELDRLFGRILLSTPMVLVCLMGIAAAAVAFFLNLQLAESRLPAFHDFFAVRRWGMLLIAMLIVKSIHEFGHGMVAKRCGCKVGEMGLMFLVFAPVLFCNVESCRMLPSRWKKCAIALGGIYFELIIAACATYIWLLTQPGQLNHLCLAIMFFASIHTLLLNLNPLLRYDGYYVLASLWGRNDLKLDADEWVTAAFRWWFTHDERWLRETVESEATDRRWLLLYGVSASIYIWLIMFGIVVFCFRWGEQYRLGPVTCFIGFYLLLFEPLRRMVQFLRELFLDSAPESVEQVPIELGTAGHATVSGTAMSEL